MKIISKSGIGMESDKPARDEFMKHQNKIKCKQHRCGLQEIHLVRIQDVR